MLPTLEDRRVGSAEEWAGLVDRCPGGQVTGRVGCLGGLGGKGVRRIPVRGGEKARLLWLVPLVYRGGSGFPVLSGSQAVRGIPAAQAKSARPDLVPSGSRPQVHLQLHRLATTRSLQEPRQPASESQATLGLLVAEARSAQHDPVPSVWVPQLHLLLLRRPGTTKPSPEPQPPATARKHQAIETLQRPEPARAKDPVMSEVRRQARIPRATSVARCWEPREGERRLQALVPKLGGRQLMGELPRESTRRAGLGGRCGGLPGAESELQARVAKPGGWRLMGERLRGSTQRVALGGQCRGLPEAEGISVDWRQPGGWAMRRLGQAGMGLRRPVSVGRGRPGRPGATGGKVGSAMLAAGPPLVTATGLPVGTTSGKATVSPRPKPNPPCRKLHRRTKRDAPRPSSDGGKYTTIQTRRPSTAWKQTWDQIRDGRHLPGSSVVTVSIFVTVEAVPPTVSVTTVVTSTGTTPSTG